MAAMNNYTIRCTLDQTRKALELGAPLYPVEEEFYAVPLYRATGNKCYEIPTAEQLINWLEEQDTFIITIGITYNEYENIWDYIVSVVKPDNRWGSRNSRKEATLAAIDAALDYLTQNKK